MKLERSSAVLSAVIVMLLLGCSTEPVPTSEATPTQSIHSSAYATQKPGTGEVIVKRDRGFVGLACTAELSVDGNRIADLGDGEMVVMFLPEGGHIISAISDNFFCFGATAETGLTAKVGVTEYVRIGYTLGGTFFMSPTTD